MFEITPSAAKFRMTEKYKHRSFLDAEGKKVAEDAMKHWMDRTCIKFKPRTTEKDFVEFQFGDG